jgi:putative tributyrin esterase
VLKVVKGVLQSTLMRREMPYRVLLPSGPAAGRESYPVLYLLHGLFGSCDNWLELTKIAEYADGRNIAIVMPEGGDGWYTDSASVESDRYESYFTSELAPKIERLFPVATERRKRGIAGLSMGGYGAFKFALKRPNAFIFAGAMSGAFEAPHRTEAAPGFDWGILGPSVNRAFGAEGSPARRDGDIFRLVNEIAEKASDLPYFYLDCGIEDGFLGINRRLAKLLKRKGIRYEYHENAGGHDWDYWDRQIERVLDVFEEKVLHTGRNSPKNQFGIGQTN